MTSQAIFTCWSLTCIAALGQGLGEAKNDVEKGLIVDCRQPNAIRKLSPGMIRVMPGKIIRTSADSCKRQSGLFVLFDQANPDVAREVWLDAAEQGDDVAQFRLGQIYEMGVKGKPDFVQAARWYKKAADQGNRQAAKNLALLREKGIGVDQDKEIAATPEKKAQAKVSETPVAAPKPLPLRPTIQLIEPSLIVTRGDMGEIPVRGEVKNKQITGRIKPVDVASLTINGKEVRPDQYGLFQENIFIGDDGATVDIVAVSREGGRDEVVLHFKPSKSIAPEQRRPPPMPEGTFGTYHALIIGNNLYRDWTELQTAVNDAGALADLLRRKYGFKVTLLRNATFDETLNAINDLVNTLTEHDNLLIYYAGHGYFDLARRGYWIPVDAERERNTRWILNVQITDLLLKMKAKKVLVISDSCYSGALAEPETGTGRPRGSARVALGDLQRELDVRTRKVLSSGGVQPVWDVNMGGNSLFARALLDVLTVNSEVLDGQRLFDAIEGRVIKTSRDISEREERAGRKSAVASDQTPVYAGIQFAGDEGGDFFFVPTATN